ncbi:MAG: hypothetical protein AAF517_25715 [Planctomycetota bacterium]
MRRLTLAFVILSGWCGQGHACSCANPPIPERALEAATAVFLGSVVSVETRPKEYMKRVTFEVLESWKGAEVDAIEVVTGRGGGDCGYPFSDGQIYLVYAHGDKELATSICSRTRSQDRAGDDLAALGEPVYPNDEELHRFLTTGGVVIAGVLLLITMGIVAVRQSGRRGS